MNIIDKMAEAMYNATGEFGLSEDDAERAAQAAWNIVRAEMLGDDVRDRCIDAVAKADAFAVGLDGKQYNHYILKAALTAAIKKLEE